MSSNLLTAFWSLGLLGAFLVVINNKSNLQTPSKPFLVILLVGLIVRLAPASILAPVSNYDIDSYDLVSQKVLAREDVYTGPDTAGRHPYLPMQMYWMGIAGWISSQFALPFPFVVRWASVVADVIVGGLVYIFLSKRNSPSFSPFVGGLLYSLNPISVYVSAAHGQFDSIPILFIILGLMSVGLSAWKTGFWLGWGILSKSWPVLALPTLWLSFNKRKDRWIVLVLGGLIPITGVILYGYLFEAELAYVVKTALSYNHGTGVWGYTYFLRVLGMTVDWLNPIVYRYLSISRFVTLGILAFIIMKNVHTREPSSQVLTILVSFLAFTHAFSIQYLIWVVPFAIIEREFTWLKWYTMAGFVYCFLAYHTLILSNIITNWLPWPLADLVIIIPAGLPVWLISVIWAFSRFNRGNRNYKIERIGLKNVA